ncbi:uncharacterized protein LOC131934684 [Physella acuta]|uniref:uncharacterized protein LOC131934684 n=1 Tax=Physella acuta TaxID=109671 RepID=UPI0027DABA24|nr:uncharacterized protein LOC131934684 [Physella acuta]
MQVIFFCCLAAVVGTVGAVYGDACSIMTGSNLGGSDKQIVEADVPKNCTFGDVDWNYPKGYLKLRLNLPGQTFSLCLEEAWATSITGVKDVTEGRDVELPLPSAGVDSCAKSAHSTVELLVSSPHGQTYMTGFNYKVIIT